MAELTAAALQVLQRQKNIITVAQLREAGVPRSLRERLVASGALQHLGHCALAVPGGAWTLERRAIALCLQHPRGYITGPTGGKLAGLNKMPRFSAICLGAPHGYRTEVPPGVQLRQTRVLPEEHLRRLDNGITIAAWPRMAFDLATDLSRHQLMSAIDQMIHLGHTDMPALVAVARLLCARGRPGSSEFASVLLERGGRAATHSDPELVILEGLLRRGVPVVPQVGDLQLPNGRRIEIDMAVEEVRWAVEVDIHPSHIELPGTARDKQRDRQCHLIDWEVERVTPLDMLDVRAILDELEQLYRARVANLARR
ncbi:MAG: hypothetical protein ACOYMR_00505 [Ilumatobacteraceae bacterium]